MIHSGCEHCWLSVVLKKRFITKSATTNPHQKLKPQEIESTRSWILNSHLVVVYFVWAWKFWGFFVVQMLNYIHSSVFLTTFPMEPFPTYNTSLFLISSEVSPRKWKKNHKSLRRRCVNYICPVKLEWKLWLLVSQGRWKALTSLCPR